MTGHRSTHFRLGLLCPFLEDDACSTEEDRPFVCRQYLVTSPAERCRDPFTNRPDIVRLPIAPRALCCAPRRIFLEKPQFTVALMLALEYAEAHRAELERMPQGVYAGPAGAGAVGRPTGK